MQQHTKKILKDTKIKCKYKKSFISTADTDRLLWNYQIFWIIRHYSGYTGLLTACSQAVSKPVWHIPLLCVQWKTSDHGQGNCPKHVKFYS
jgi:hypothetical protein